MKLFIVRHGESQANAQGYSQGKYDDWRDTGLTPLGKEQAKKIACRLKDKDISLIICSDLKRARQTADAINKYHQVPLKLDHRLRDIMDDETLEQYIPKMMESFADITKESGNVVVVAHGSSCLSLVAVATGSREEGSKIVEQYASKYGNTCLSIIEKQGTKYKIHIVACGKHL